MVLLGLIICVFGIAYLFSIVFVFGLIIAFLSGDLDPSAIGLGPTLASVTIFAIGTICLVYGEKEKAKTKGRECDAVCLEGIPDFELEQKLHLTLDVPNRVILMDGRKEKDVPSKHRQNTITKHLKDTQVRLRFQQIIKLNYICWEGDAVRWRSGSNGYSYPGLFEGTRVYVPPASGYSYTEQLKVDYALEIQYRDQHGLRDRIVLKVNRFDDYVYEWLEALCRCTGLPAPQYIEPVKPVKPGPKYL